MQDLAQWLEELGIAQPPGSRISALNTVAKLFRGHRQKVR
jgi:hypothetical protein